VNAAIFFGQLRYWSERTENPLGVYKTAEEWARETGLSYREQVTARRVLSEPGFVVETNKRLEHRLFFLIDWDAFNPAFECWSPANPPATKEHPPNNPKRNPPNDDSAVREELNRRSSISTEITTETTAEKEKNTYAAEFETAWMSYPDRPGKNKVASYKAWNARLKSGCTAEEMLHGVSSYAAYCTATQTDPGYIKQPATFFGPDMHFRSDWRAPAAQSNKTRQDKNATWLAAMTTPQTPPGAPDDHAQHNFFGNDNTFDAESRFLD
jgi:hypothetical protein